MYINKKGGHFHDHPFSYFKNEKYYLKAGKYFVDFTMNSGVKIQTELNIKQPANKRE